jgi:hypothetical protein
MSLDDHCRPCGFGLASVSDLLTTRALIGHPRETFKNRFLNTDGASFEIGFTMGFRLLYTAPQKLILRIWSPLNEGLAVARPTTRLSSIFRRGRK